MDTLIKYRVEVTLVQDFQKLIMDGFWARFNLGLVTKIAIRACCVPGVMMRDRPETEADLGTLLAGDLGFSGVSSWWAMRRDAPLLKDGLVPVLLLLRRMRRRLETTPSTIRGYKASALVFHDSKLQRMRRGLCTSVSPSSSADMAKRGMMSRLWVLFITSGLALRSDWDELDEARGRRLRGKTQPGCQ